MPKKLIDIYPPKKFDDSIVDESLILPKDSSSSNIFGLQAKKLWFGLPLLIIPFLAVHFLFADAKITVWPQITELHVLEQIVAQVDQPNVDLEQKLIPAKIFEQEKEATKSFAATGKEEREEKAGGTIRVFNDNPSLQTLVVNTRFISEDGKLFRSRAKISIPAAQGGDAGFFDVVVVAAEAGSDYNIASSNFSLPGLAGSALFTKVYGKSSSSMTGGAIGEVLVVTTEDIRKAKESLLRDLKIDAKTSLLSRIPSNFIILESSMETELLQDNSLVQEGAVLEEFTYTMSLKVSTLAFTKEDGIILAQYIFRSYLEDIQKIKEDTFTVRYEVEAANTETGRMVLSVDIAAEVYIDIDLKALQNRLQGASRRDIIGIVNEFPSLERAEFSLWPFWIQNVSRDATKVEVEFSL